MELNTVKMFVDAFYRLVGTESGDDELELRGEAADDVAYIFLTRGSRTAQRWMIKMGYGGWRKRTSALTFTGSDDTDGGTKVALPNDFLRGYGNQRQSMLREANGKRWGQEIDPEDDHLRGDKYYIRGQELWLTRGASPPTTLYGDYHYTHPLWNAALANTSIDFPTDARSLIPAEAAVVAKEENWVPGGEEMELKIERALKRAQEEARDVARPTKEPRKFRRPKRFANRW